MGDPEPIRHPSRLHAAFRRFWPPLPVWRRLDAAVALVAVYTALVDLSVIEAGLNIPDWGGGSTILNALILGVLLGFRNKEAYERWWEGRKLWGQLINDSRSLCAKFAELPHVSRESKARMRLLVPGFAVALKNRLRDGGGLAEVPGFEGTAEDPVHVPLYVYARIFGLLQAERSAGRMTEIDIYTVDSHVRALMDICGSCERIKGTPVPMSYRALLRHGLVLYLLSTPWLIASKLLWASVPVMAMLAYFLLGIEFTAEDVEDPFGRDGDDLALSAYCDIIRRAAEQALA